MGNPQSKDRNAQTEEKKSTESQPGYQHIYSNTSNNVQQFQSDNNNNNNTAVLAVVPKSNKKKKPNMKFEILDPLKLFETGVRVKCFCLPTEEVKTLGTLKALENMLMQKDWRFPRVVLLGSYSNGKSFVANLLEKAGFKEGPHPTTHHIVILLCKGYQLWDTAGFNAFTDRTCTVQEREAQDYLMRQVLFAISDWMIYLSRDLKKIEDIKAVKEIVMKNNFNSKSSKNILVVSNLLRVSKYSQAKDQFYAEVLKLGDGCPRATEVFIQEKSTGQIKSYIVEWWESYGEMPNDFPNWKGSYHVFLMKDEGEGAIHNRYVAKLLKKFLRNGPTHSTSERSLLEEFTTILTRTIPDKLKINSPPSLVVSELSHTTLLLKGKCDIAPEWRETRMNKKDIQISGEVENEVGLKDDKYCVIVRATEIIVKRLFDQERGTILEISGERRAMDDMMMEDVEGELPNGSFSIRLQIPPQFRVTKRMVTENSMYVDGSWILLFPRKENIYIPDLLKQEQAEPVVQSLDNNNARSDTDEWQITESWNEGECKPPFDKPIQISIQADHIPEPRQNSELQSANSEIVPIKVNLSKDHKWLIRVRQPTSLGVRVEYIQNKTCLIFFGVKEAPMQLDKNFVKKSQYGPFEITKEIPAKYSVSKKIILDNKFDPKEYIRIFSFPQKKPFEVKLSKLESEVVNNQDASVTTEDWHIVYEPLDDADTREARNQNEVKRKEKKAQQKLNLEAEKQKKKSITQPSQVQAKVESDVSKPHLVGSPVVKPANAIVPPPMEPYPM